MDEDVKEYYDKNGNLIYYKSFGFEKWYKYDENGERIGVAD